MRRILAIGLASALVAAAGAGATRTPAHVRLVDRSPVKIMGTGFRAHEHVVLRVADASGDSWTARTTASSAGRFTVTLAEQSIPSCDAYTVAAAGLRGTRAAERHTIPPACGIVISP